MASGFRFKGTIEVKVDDARLEARLMVRREGDLEYDEGAVVRILSDAGVTTGFDLDAILGQIQGLQKTKEPSREFVAAQGTPATPASGETWVWDPALLPIPDEQKALAARVIKAAGPPEVQSPRGDKILVTDPTLVKLFWVEAGASVATVQPPKAGVPGSDLGGKPIAAPPAPAATFATSRTLDRWKNEVTAQVTGFLRVGRTWADIAPHRPHRWVLTYSDDKTSAYLTFEPGDAAADSPAVGPIFDQLRQAGFTADRLPEESALKDLLVKSAREGRVLESYSLGGDRDGSFAIEYSPDRTKATLRVHKALGNGRQVDLREMGTALKNAQLVGFSFEAFQAAMQTFFSGPDTELTNYLLASGRPASRGADLQIVWTAGFLPDEEVKKIQAAVQANAKALEAVPDRSSLAPGQVQKAGPVQAEQAFAQLSAEGLEGGAEGVDVHGKPVPPVPGNEPQLGLLANVRKNGSQLVSLIDGLLEVGEVNGVTMMRVRPHVDAMAAVSRSPDNLQAWLTLVQGRGTGKRLDRALVDQALSRAQINHGLNEEAVARALETAQSGAKVEHVLVAEGAPAANDLARRLTFPMPLRTDPTGRRRASVRAEEVVATYRPPEEGQVDGIDVLGNRIPSPDQEAKSLVIGADFAIETDDAGLQVIKALRGGDFVFDGETISLIHTVQVAGVGGKVGNVKFTGEVFVAGAVETGGYVMAGNLKVKGRVGGALLSSDHNIQVVDGVHGEGKAVLRAKRHVSVGFIERALIMAVGDVHVGKSALGCTFRVNGRVLQKTPGGGVQGGTGKVRLGLDVMNLGSPSGTPTSISFGQDYLVEDQILAEMKETDKLREAIVQIDQLLRRLGAPSDREKLNAAREKKVTLMKMLAKRNLKLIHLRDKFELHVPSEIVVRETLFPGVSIESHGRIYEPRGRRTAVRLVFDQQSGRIEEHPITE